MRNYGLVVISREGSDPEKFVEDNEMLRVHKHNIHHVTEDIRNEVSSTKIRAALKEKRSIKYLVTDSVIQYIAENDLFT